MADDDADELLSLFRRVVASGRQLAFMAHFNHPVEVESPVALEAMEELRQQMESAAVVLGPMPGARSIGFAEAQR